MQKIFVFVFIIVLSLVVFNQKASAQTGQSAMFRLSEGFVRIAEPGQIADTLSVWGDINAPGRYIIPRGTTVHELISYARGPIGSRTAGQNLDWSKVRLEINVSRFQENSGTESIFSYTHIYN